MSALDALPGAVDQMATNVADMAADVALQGADLAAIQAKLPTAGRAASDVVWDLALATLLAEKLGRMDVSPLAEPPVSRIRQVRAVGYSAIDAVSQAGLTDNASMTSIYTLAGRGYVDTLAIFAQATYSFPYAAGAVTYAYEVWLDGMLFNSGGATFTMTGGGGGGGSQWHAVIGIPVTSGQPWRSERTVFLSSLEVRASLSGKISNYSVNVSPQIIATVTGPAL